MTDHKDKAKQDKAAAGGSSKGQPAGGRTFRQGDPSQPGVMGDETIEQNLNQKGNPDAAITREDVEAAFDQGKTDQKNRQR